MVHHDVNARLIAADNASVNYSQGQNQQSGQAHVPTQQCFVGAGADQKLYPSFGLEGVRGPWLQG